MQPRPFEPSVAQTLERLGMSPDQSVVYLHLLNQGPQSANHLARTTSLSRSRVERTLSELALSGLVKRLPGKITRFQVVSPEEILPILMKRRDQETEELSRSLDDFVASHRTFSGSAADAGEYIEIVTGPRAIAIQLDRQLGTAQEEVLSFTKAPLIRRGNPAEDDFAARGVTARVLWERNLLEDPDMMELAQGRAATGEQVRVCARLPSKLLIVDRTTALIHVTEDSQGLPVMAALVTRHRELVTTLHQSFESLWNEAVPFLETSADMQAADSTREPLIACLSAGMGDPAIMRTLGVSRRTLTRRIQELMDELGASTRFEAGLKLSQRTGGNS